MRVSVVETATRKILSGEAAPLASQLDTWLELNPGWVKSYFPSSIASQLYTQLELNQDWMKNNFPFCLDSELNIWIWKANWHIMLIFQIWGSTKSWWWGGRGKWRGRGGNPNQFILVYTLYSQNVSNFPLKIGYANKDLFLRKVSFIF